MVVQELARRIKDAQVVQMGKCTSQRGWQWCVLRLDSTTKLKACVSLQSLPVAKDFFNPHPLVLKVLTMPKPC